MWRRPIINTGVQILGKTITVGVGLVTTGILTRKLGVEAYGNYTLILAVFVFLDSLADFGTRIIGVREMAREKEEKVWGQFFWLRLIMTGWSSIVAIIVVGLWPGLGNLRTEVWLATGMMWMTSMAGSLEIIWQTEMKMERKVIVEVAYPLLFLAALWGVRGEISLKWVFGTYLVARAITLMFGWWWVRKQAIMESPKWIKIKKYFRLAWPMGVYLLVFTAYDRAVDSLMIQRLVGVRELAWYGLAYKIYATLLQPAYFLVSSVFPLLAKTETDKKIVFKGTGLILGVAGGLMLIGGWTLSPFMIGVLGGEEFEPAILILRILLVAAVFSYFGHLVGFGLIAEGGQKQMLKMGVINLVFNVVMNLIFIGKFGIVGAAGVTVATEAVSLGLMARELRKVI